MNPLPTHATTEVTDAELVRSSLAGDREAFGDIVRRYQTLVASLIYSATGDLGRSEDLAQETFVAAWRRLIDLREPARLRGWLCGIARRLVRGSRRAALREPVERAAEIGTVAESLASEAPPVDRVMRREEAAILWRSLERIPETYRTALVLFYREHRSVESVARALGLNEAAVRQRLSRGRRLLEAEVAGFVESALERSAPDARFALGVLAALPGGAIPASVATAGATVGKGGMGSLGSGGGGLAGMGSSLALAGAILASWVSAIREARTPAERRMRTRAATVQLACFGATWAGVVYGTRWAPGSIGVLALGVGLALFLNVVVAVVVADRLARGRETAEAPRGVDCPRARAVPEQVAASWTWSRAFPFVLLLSASALGLPWRGYPVRSAVLFGALVAVVGIGVLRLRRQATGTVRAEGCESTVTSATPGRRLGMRFAGVILGAAAIGGLVPFLFRPGRTDMVAVLRGPGAGVGGGILLAALASMAFVAWYFRNRLGEPSPESLVDEVYEPLLREWKRGRSFDKRLKALVLEKSWSVARRMTVGTGGGVEVRGTRAWIDAVRTEIAARDAALRNHVGEKDFERFRRFERTVPERALVRRFARRMAGTREALTAETEAALVRALEQARLEFPWSTAAGRREPSGAVLDLLSEEGEGRLATFEEEDSRFRAAFRRVAGGLLTPAGATAFCDFWDGERQIEIRALRDLSRGGSVCPLDSRGGFRLTSRT